MALTLTTYSTNPVCNSASTPTGGCVQGTAGVTPTGGSVPYAYTWTKNGALYSNDQNLYFLGAGAYNVVVIDSAVPPLAATALINITQPSPILISFTLTAVVCSGSNGTITANASGGMGGYTCLWSTGATTSSISAPSGNYSVMVTDANGCIATSNIFLPDSTPVTVEIEQTLEQCYLESITLTANPRGGKPPYTVLWSPDGQTTLSITPPLGSANGETFDVTATDFNGCTGKTQIYIPFQIEAWQCCLGQIYAKQAQAMINGNEVCGEQKTSVAMLAMCINAYARFSRNCLTAEQKQVMVDYINSFCNCGCGNVAAQQQLI